MLSDTLFESIQEIEHYQREFRCYDDMSEDIDAVKKVMTALQERLDHPQFEYPLDVAETLSPEQKERWRVTCEANIARWAERLRLLRPVSAEELVGTLDDAIERQAALLDEESRSENGLRREVMHKACQHWNKRATGVAGDALVDILKELPEEAEGLVAPISRLSDLWTMDMAKAVLGWRCDARCDYKALLEALDQLGTEDET